MQPKKWSIEFNEDDETKPYAELVFSGKGCSLQPKGLADIPRPPKSAPKPRPPSLQRAKSVASKLGSDDVFEEVLQQLDFNLLKKLKPASRSWCEAVRRVFCSPMWQMKNQVSLAQMVLQGAPVSELRTRIAADADSVRELVSMHDGAPMIDSYHRHAKLTPLGLHSDEHSRAAITHLNSTHRLNDLTLVLPIHVALSAYSLKVSQGQGVGSRFGAQDVKVPPPFRAEDITEKLAILLEEFPLAATLPSTLSCALELDVPPAAIAMILKAHPDVASLRVGASSTIQRLLSFGVMVADPHNLARSQLGGANMGKEKEVTCLPLHVAIVRPASDETIFALLDACPTACSVPLTKDLAANPLMLALRMGASKALVMRLLAAHTGACAEAHAPNVWALSSYGRLPRVLDRVDLGSDGCALLVNRNGPSQVWTVARDHHHGPSSYDQHHNASASELPANGVLATWSVHALHVALSESAHPEVVMAILEAWPAAAAVGEPRSRDYWAAVRRNKSGAEPPQHNGAGGGGFGMFDETVGMFGGGGFGGGGFGAANAAGADATDDDKFPGLPKALHVTHGRDLGKAAATALNEGLGTLLSACFKADPPAGTDEGGDEGGDGGGDGGGATARTASVTELDIDDPAKLAAVRAYLHATWSAVQPAQSTATLTHRAVIELTLPDGYALRSTGGDAGSTRGLTMDRWFHTKGSIPFRDEWFAPANNGQQHNGMLYNGNQQHTRVRPREAGGHPFALRAHQVHQHEHEQIEVRIHRSLPLHEALLRRYPPAVIQALVHAYPPAASTCNAYGWLPVEIALEMGLPAETIGALVAAGAPDSAALNEGRQESLKLIESRMEELTRAQQIGMGTPPVSVE